MLAHENYGQTECDVFWFYLREYASVAWVVAKQDQVIVGDRKIDCIEQSVSENPDKMNNAWVEKYYFYITDYLLNNLDLQ